MPAAYHIELLAGMPAPPVLTDIARARLEVLSFFVVVFLLAALAVKVLWNSIAKRCPSWGTIGYLLALGLTSMWGVALVLVLTLISGARELMTPGAWERNGITYRLSGPPATDADSRLRALREQGLQRLRDALWKYAAAHGGRFPPHDFGDAIAESLWLAADPSGIRLIYVPSLKADKGAVPLVYEPGIFGSVRLVLLTDGSIGEMTLEEIRQALREGLSP